MADENKAAAKRVGMSRREALTTIAAATAASSLGFETRDSAAATNEGDDSMSHQTGRMPVIYMPHGGGPWPFMDFSPMVSHEESAGLADYLKALPRQLPRRPRAMVVVSAHWEASVPTVQTSPHPPILYDYYGFPPETYRILWPAPGDPKLAARVRGLLESAGFRTAEDSERGFDHGTFVPLKLTYPEADVPTIQLSLEEGLDPARHIRMGKALAPLRDEGVLLVGSGMSYHNLRTMRQWRNHPQASVAFDEWLRGVAVDAPMARNAALVAWRAAPAAHEAHPREEHLLPLMVAAGAAEADRGSVAYNATFGGARISAVHFGI